MNGEYNIWNKWDPLKTVMLGDCYSAEFFKDIKNDRIRSALTQIADETQEDLAYYEQVLKDFGCEVIRPELDRSDSIMNYINDDGAVNGRQGVPRSPLQPRDNQLVIGNELMYTTQGHNAINKALYRYNPTSYKLPYLEPMSQETYNRYKGNGAPDWPSYEEYVYSFGSGAYSANKTINDELQHLTEIDSNDRIDSPLTAPSITVVGKDIYIDLHDIKGQKDKFMDVGKYYDQFKNRYSDFRINELFVGGHSDSCFHTLKPGALISLKEIQTYNDTFPGWDVCYLPDQSWDKVRGFSEMKYKVEGKWWVPGQEDNDEFTYFVETWLNDWVGYVEETVFDVNVLVLDEHHVCVNNMNPTVIEFLKKHGMEAVHIPWRHRYFWDGGLHCITLDLYRKGSQQDYFPNRTQSVNDKGYF